MKNRSSSCFKETLRLSWGTDTESSWSHEQAPKDHLPLSRGGRAFVPTIPTLGLLGTVCDPQCRRASGATIWYSRNRQGCYGSHPGRNTANMTANHLLLPTLPPCCTCLQVSYDTYDLVLVTVAGVHCLLAKNLAEHSTHSVSLSVHFLNHQ